MYGGKIMLHTLFKYINEGVLAVCIFICLRCVSVCFFKDISPLNTRRIIAVWSIPIQASCTDQASVAPLIIPVFSHKNQTLQGSDEEAEQEGDGASTEQKRSTQCGRSRDVVTVIATAKCLFCKG